MTQTKTTPDDIRTMAHKTFQAILNKIHFYTKSDHGEELSCDLNGCLDEIEAVYEKGWNDAKGI